MADLANAIAEVFAALLRAVGFVGRPRQRAAIREDLALLRELDEFPGDDFGPGTAPHIWLVSHIYNQVGEFAGLDMRTERRKAGWPSILFATAVWAALGWVAYYLVDNGYGWWATFPIVPAVLMFVTTIGLVTEKEPVGELGDLSEYEEGQADDEDLAAIEELGPAEPPDASEGDAAP